MLSIATLIRDIVSSIDSSKPPISGFKKTFLSWPEDVKDKFYRAVNAWHGTTMEDNKPDLLINFAQEHPEQMKQYQEWLRSLASGDTVTLYRGFAGEFAQSVAEDVRKALKEGKDSIMVTVKPYTSWSTSEEAARRFSDAVILKYKWPVKEVFHADAGRGFLKQMGYDIQLRRTERELVIKNPGTTITLHPTDDVTLRGKFRAWQRNFNKKQLTQKNTEFAEKLEVGKKYIPYKSEFPYWEELREKGGLVYKGQDPKGLKFEYPDGREHVVTDIEWLRKHVEI